MTDTPVANTAVITPTRTTKLLSDNGTADGAVTPAALFGLLQASDIPTSLTPITTTYTASGPVAVTDRLAVLSATATLAMTLAAPTVDGQPMTIKRRGIGGFSLTLTLDDVAGKVLSGTGGSTAPKDVINLIGVLTPTPTWLLSA